MATDTTTPDRTVGEVWAKLEPAMLTPRPDTKHSRLQASRVYPAGQLIGRTAVTGVWASEAHGGAPNDADRLFPTVYPYATNASGYATLGTAFNANDQKNESVEHYYQGCFFAKDLTGLTEANLAKVGRIVQGSVTDDDTNVFSADCIIELG